MRSYLQSFQTFARRCVGLMILFVAMTGCGNEVSEATKQLSDPDPVVRQQAARTLAESQGDTEQSLSQLRESLKDPDVTVRQYAARAIGQIGPAAKDAIPGLVLALEDDNLAVQMNAAISLVNIAPDDPASVEFLAGRAREDDPRAIVALGQLGSTAKDAVPALLHALRSSKSVVRTQAANALGRIGPAAENALPTLKRYAKHRDEDFRIAIQDAIKMIESQ